MGVHGWTMAGIRQESLERGGHFFTRPAMRANAGNLPLFELDADELRRKLESFIAWQRYRCVNNAR